MNEQVDALLVNELQFAIWLLTYQWDSSWVASETARASLLCQIPVPDCPPFPTTDGKRMWNPRYEFFATDSRHKIQQNTKEFSWIHINWRNFPLVSQLLSANEGQHDSGNSVIRENYFINILNIFSDKIVNALKHRMFCVRTPDFGLISH